jgi:hypothetical protein
MSKNVLNLNNVVLEENINLGPNVERVSTEGSLNSIKTKNSTRKRAFHLPSMTFPGFRRATASFFRTPSPLNSSNEEVQASPLWKAYERRNLPLIKKLAANIGYTNKVTLAVRNAAEDAHETLITDIMANSYVGKYNNTKQNEQKLLEKIVHALAGTTESSGGKRKTKRKRKIQKKKL